MRSILLSIFLLFTALSNAQEILLNNENELKVKVRGMYTLGQEDSLSYARTQAIRDAKRQASEIAGSYIKVRTVVKNGKLQEEYIEVLTSSIVSLKILDEGIKLEGKRTLVYYVDAEISVDKKGLERALREVLADSRKIQRLKQLIKESQDLKRELKKLSDELERVIKEKKAYEKDIQRLKNLISKKDLDIKKKDKLIKELSARLEKLEKLLKRKKYIQSRREEIIIKQANIEKEAVLLFKRGSLLTLAKATMRKKEKAFEDIKENFFGYIIRNTEIEIGDVKINPKGNNLADIYVPVRWNISTKELAKVLEKYLNFEITSYAACKGESRGIKISEFDNEKEKQKKSYSKELYDFIANHDVVIEVSVGKYRGYLTIGTAIDCFFQNKDRYTYRLVTEGREGTLLWEFKEQNPVLIKNVPMNVLEKVDRISFKVKVK